MIKVCLCLIGCVFGVCRWSLPHGHARTNVGGTRPHSDSGTDVKPLIQDTHTHIHTHTHILALLTQHPHTLSTNPVSLLQSSRGPPCVSRSGDSTTAGWHTTVFCNKIITKITVSKEQRDERDNNHLLYSPAQLHLFLFLVPRLPVDQ